jgi:hypothetical protein
MNISPVGDDEPSCIAPYSGKEINRQVLPESTIGEGEKKEKALS